MGRRQQAGPRGDCGGATVVGRPWWDCAGPRRSGRRWVGADPTTPHVPAGVHPFVCLCLAVGCGEREGSWEGCFGVRVICYHGASCCSVGLWWFGPGGLLCGSNGPAAVGCGLGVYCPGLWLVLWLVLCVLWHVARVCPWHPTPKPRHCRQGQMRHTLNQQAASCPCSFHSMSQFSGSAFG